MSSTVPPSMSGQDRKLSHLSLAPPALETPSRFASRANASVSVSPRSRRGRALRARPRLVGLAVAASALAAVVASWIGGGAIGRFIAQAWRTL